MKYIVFIVLVVLSVCLPSAQPTLAAVSPQRTYTYWSLPGTNYYNIDTPILPLNDPQPEAGQVKQAYHYYSYFTFASGSPGWVGIQTDDGGKRALFSLWNADAAECADLPDAICQSFNENGETGFQTMIPYQWVAGHVYSARIWELNTDETGEWWVGAILDNTLDTEAIIGYIHVPEGHGWLSGTVGTFVDWYGPQVDACSQLPFSAVAFNPPEADDGTEIAKFSENQYGSEACPSRFIRDGSRTIHNTGAVTPVIFIPGIAGSRLVTSSPSNLVPCLGRKLCELWPGGLLQDHSKLLDLTDKTIFALDALESSVNTDYYRGFFDMLKQSGYIAYDFHRNGDENADQMRGKEQCDKKQTTASLFVLPYDFRQKSQDIAKKLNDYVECIRQIYNNPALKIDIVTHSQGSLIARRYILEHPRTHGVRKLITAGAPWLGAPKAVTALETGAFLDPIQKAFTGLSDGDFKKLVRAFPGVHQLVPSRVYYDLAEVSPFDERGWDINKNGRAWETYNYAQIVALLNTRSRAGDTNKEFHDTPGQDDWRTDVPRVEYVHLVSRLSKHSTIVKNTATKAVQCIPGSTGFAVCFSPEVLTIEYGVGDGTVPWLSAARMRYDSSRNILLTYNAPNAQVITFSPYSRESDKDLVHSSLFHNNRIQKCVLNKLFGVGCPEEQSGLSLPTAKTSNDGPITPMRYLTLLGTTAVTVTDSLGNVSSTEAISLTTQPVPEVTIDSLGITGHDVLLPIDVPLVVTLHTAAGVLDVDLREGTGTTATTATRYHDIAVPSDVMTRLSLDADGTPHLATDTAKNGSFETSIPPLVSVTGTQANDLDAPIITPAVDGPLTARRVSLDTTDVGTGVKSVWYSLDGTQFMPYTEPVTVDFRTTPVIYVFADDMVANRSGLVRVTLGHKVFLPTLER